MSLLTFHTPDGPLLTMCFRHHECFTFVVCDFGEPDVRRMLDSWRKQRGLQIQMVLGNKLVWHLEPARDSEIEELDRFREEVKTNDELAFVRSLAFARENGLLEEYAAQEATQRPRRLPKEGLVIEVNMLYTERFVDATVAYLK
ncbi:hypothetical protein P3T18_003121 [Paraburkholderia sp. GAS199]|uniref:hypothetical protein n=1 Tax=Paraburkholderia sp. GAS199 TaxID=3035126 RepID=UPI003D1B02AC